MRGSHSLSFLNDGSDLSASIDTGGDTWNFLSGGLEGFKGAPGSGAPTVPLVDGECSTVGQANPQMPSQPPQTTYTYDPFGNTTISGQPSTFPFQFLGLEHGVTEPGQLYLINGRNLYNPQNPAPLSPDGQYGLGGTNGGPAPHPFNDGWQRGGGIPFSAQEDTIIAGTAAASLVAGPEGGGAATAAVMLATEIISGLINGWETFLSFFGGGPSHPTPRQLLHGRHPAYPNLDGIDPDLITDMQPVLDWLPKNKDALQKATVFYCTREVQVFPWVGNHAFLFNVLSGQSCQNQGSAPSAGNALLENKDQAGIVCRPISFSEGNESELFSCCNTNDPDYLNGGFYFPGINDCHTKANRCIYDKGFDNPGAPGGRLGKRIP